MAKKYLDYEGLSHFWSEIKGLFVKDINYDSSTHQITKTKGSTTGNVVAIPYKTSDLTNDSGYITSADVPEGSSASTVTPIMDGTASKGTDNGFARGDHVHPTDTSRVPTTRTVNGKALSANINISARDIASVLGGTATDLEDDIEAVYGLATQHSHGNITNAGALQTTDITIANGDKLVVTDASNSNKVAKTSISFDGSTTTKALTPKGTWETFSKDGQANVLEGVQMIGTDLTITSKKVNIPRVSFTSAGVLPSITGETTDGAYNLFAIVSSGNITANCGVLGLGCTPYSNDVSIHLLKDDVATGEFASIPSATTTAAGVMSSADKTKLNSITMTNGVIDSSVLPSFVDDVIEAYARSNQTELGSTWLATGSASGTVITPETGKIYVLMNNSTSYDANSQFRWGGTAYVKLSDGGVSSITNAEIDTILAS